jgi:hypothetical protein
MHIDFKAIANYKILRVVAMIAGCAVVLVFVFAAGVFVGVEKARFSYGWGENYYRNFVDDPVDQNSPGASKDIFWDKNYITPHGVAGEIIEIDDSGMILRGPNDMEIPVSFSKSMTIKDNKHNLKIKDLNIGINVVVIGAPNDQGAVSAKFIRIDNGFLK